MVAVYIYTMYIIYILYIIVSSEICGCCGRDRTTGSTRETRQSTADLYIYKYKYIYIYYLYPRRAIPIRDAGCALASAATVLSVRLSRGCCVGVGQRCSFVLPRCDSGQLLRTAAVKKKRNSFDGFLMCDVLLRCEGFGDRRGRTWV